MRYLARWSNGFWKSFDRVRFVDVGIHMTKVEALAAVAGLNKKKR